MNGESTIAQHEQLTLILSTFLIELDISDEKYNKNR